MVRRALWRSLVRSLAFPLSRLGSIIWPQAPVSIYGSARASDCAATNAASLYLWPDSCELLALAPSSHIPPREASLLIITNRLFRLLLLIGSYASEKPDQAFPGSVVCFAVDSKRLLKEARGLFPPSLVHHQRAQAENQFARFHHSSTVLPSLLYWRWGPGDFPSCSAFRRECCV